MDSKSFENSIKRSFEDSNNALPENLWENLSDKLSDSDAYLDKKVKESFEKKSTTPPILIWQSVNRQLQIDSIWKAISIKLDSHNIKFYKKELAIVIGLLVSFLTLNNYLLNDFNKDSLVYTNIIDNVASNKKNNPSSYSQKMNSKEVAISEENKLSGKRNILKNRKTKIITNKTDSNKNVAVETFQENTTPAHHSTNDVIKSLRNKVTLIPMDSYKEFDSSYYKLTTLEITIDSIPKFKKSVDFGITTSFNNTWILNNDVRNSFNQNSLTASIPSFNIHYGVMFNYNFSKKSSFSSEVYINSNYKQSYTQFSEGYLITKNSEANYYKGVVLYQLNLTPFNFHKHPSTYILKAGPYFSALKTEKHYVSNKSSLANNEKYSNVDYGLKFAAGIDKNFGRIVLGYGVNVEYGLKNILQSNTQLNAKFNPTNNMLGGVYINARYLISKK